MWDKKKKAPVVPYLICIVVLWISVFVVSRMLTEYSVLYKESGVISWQYIVYVIVGMLFTTPAPMIALFITLRRSEGITVKEYFKKFLYTENKILTAVVTGGFCLLALLFAIMNGIGDYFYYSLWISGIYTVSASIFVYSHTMFSFIFFER